MSRRCRDSLQERASQGSSAGSGLDSGCDCGRLTGQTVTAPCQEPYIVGANILTDEGMETQLTLFGGGPGGDEIPWVGAVGGATGRGLAFFSDDSSVYLPFWVQAGAPDNPIGWVISTDDPDVGLFHAQLAYAPGTANTGQFGIIPYTFFRCASTTGGLSWGYRVQPGDLVVLSMRAKFNQIVAGGAAPKIQLAQTWLDTEDNVTTGGTQTLLFEDLTGAYATYSASKFVPQVSSAGNPIYRASTAWRGNLNLVGGSGEGTVLFDNAVVGILSAGIHHIICAQSNLITIDNSTTETDFL